MQRRFRPGQPVEVDTRSTSESATTDTAARTAEFPSNDMLLDELFGGQEPAQSFDPELEWLAGEDVESSSPEEALEARQVIDRIEQNYGVDVNSHAAVEVMNAKYTWIDEQTRSQIQTEEWTLESLEALERALSHFEPILGEQRAGSARAGTPQEVQAVSMVDQALNFKGDLDPRVGGEYFRLAKTFTMYSRGLEHTPDFDDVETQMEGLAVHEIAHGVFMKDVDAFAEAMDFWIDEETPSGLAHAEAPITEYGRTNAHEDLSETVMFYFVEPERLREQCPQRFAYLAELVAGWEDAPPQAKAAESRSEEKPWWASFMSGGTKASGSPETAQADPKQESLFLDVG